MFKKKIKNRTIRDIFVELLGEKNTKVLLAKVQEQYDNGVRGEALKDFAKKTIDEMTDLRPESVKLVVIAIAIFVALG